MFVVMLTVAPSRARGKLLEASSLAGGYLCTHFFQTKVRLTNAFGTRVRLCKTGLVPAS
jgi:hypothetical protein